MFYHPIFDTVRDFLHNEAMAGHEKALQRFLKQDVLIMEKQIDPPLPRNW